jgi:copper(I)-binding protein
MSVLRTMALMLVLAAACGCEQRSQLQVSNAWSGALPPTATVGAAYMTIKSDVSDELLSAQTPIAERIEFHTTQNANGMMQMRELHRLQIEPKTPLTFAPGANHMMLLGLHKPLVAGNTFPITLQFRQSGSVAVTIQVRNGSAE